MNKETVRRIGTQTNSIRLFCVVHDGYFDNKISEAHHAVKKLIQRKYGVKL